MPSSSSSLTLRCVPTELGEASFLSRLNVSEVASLARSLSQLNTRVDVSNSLQIVYHLTPLSAELRIPVAAALDYVHRFLTDAEMQFAHRELLPLHVLTALREGRGAESFSADTQSRLKRFLACLVVNDLLRFDNLERTKQIFGLSKGVLQGVQTACRVFYHTNLRVLKCLHYDLLYEVFKGFEMHMATDLTPETLALVNLGIELNYAIILTNNGYTSVDSILREESIVLVALLMDQMPWQNAYCEEDLSAETENEYEKCCYIVEQIRKRLSRC